MAEKLTEARTRAAPVKEQRYSLIDSKEAGLELRVCKNGKKIWALRASVEGKDVRLKIGLYGPAPLMSLEEARGAAAELKVRLRNEGDFRDTDKAARADERARRAFTMGDLCDAWLKEQAKHLRASTLALYKGRIDAHVRPRFGDWSIESIRRSDVRAAVNAIGERRPRTANAIKQLIAGLFKFAQDELEIDVANPAAGMKGFRIAPRQRALSDVELKRWWDAVENPDLPPGPTTKLALKFALFSAQRAGEVAGMRDCELDFDERVWIVPPERTKAGRANLVPLTDHLIGLIKQAQAMRTPPKDQQGRALPFAPDAPVFGLTRHAVTRGQARLVAKIDTEEAPFAAATVHDLRRTCRTILARGRLGVSHEAAERLLSHLTGDTLSRVYNVHAYSDEKRRALEALSAELDRIVNGLPIVNGANVVTLSDKRALGH